MSAFNCVAVIILMYLVLGCKYKEKYVSLQVLCIKKVITLQSVAAQVIDEVASLVEELCNRVALAERSGARIVNCELSIMNCKLNPF